MDALTTYLTLAFTPGLGPRKIKLLSEHFGDAGALANATTEELIQVEGVAPKLASAIVEARGSAKVAEEVKRELERASRLGVTLLPLCAPSYPTSLRQIYDPPPVLYVRGTLPEGVSGELAELRAVGVVGTRSASDYGLSLSRALGQDLARAGVTVVSGLALGVDTAAHEGALETPDGPTVAVLGSGVDVIYPRQNARLAGRIAQGHGAVVSEYRLGTQPRAEHFPGRNRIVSGLSKGVVVVEGGQKSGALITAEYALEEGRTVFAVPGRAGDPRAAGALELLKQGAVLTQSAQDILNEFGWNAESTSKTVPKLELTGLQKDLADAIRAQGEPLLDDLITATGKSAPDLLPTLMTLELQGVIRALPSGRYAVR